jgi:hypothetical protein
MKNKNNQIKKEESIIDIINNYAKILYTIKSKFDLYKYLKETKNKFFRVYKSVSGLCNLIEESLVRDIIMSLSRIYDIQIDKDKSSGKDIIRKGRCSGYNILRFLHSIKKEKNNLNIEEGISLIKSETEKIKTIKLWRDKFIGHSEEKYFLNPFLLSGDAPLKDKDLEALITLSITIINKYSSLLGNAYYSIENCFVKGEVDLIFKTMNKYFEDFDKKKK